MPGALTWDPDRSGGGKTNWRGQQNAGAGGLPLVNTDLSPASQAMGANMLAITAAGLVVRASADLATWSAVQGDGLMHQAFTDTFRRPDTSAGTIGGGWTAKGPYVSSYPLPAATSGKITAQAVEEPNGVTTYWMRALPATPKKLQLRFSYKDLANGNAVFQVLALICTNSAANLIDNMGLHITTNHSSLNIQERILATGAAFVNLVPFLDILPQRLNLDDGENLLTVEIDAPTNSGVLRLNQFVVPFASPNLAANIGSTVAFEIYNPSAAAVRWRLRVLEFSASW